MNIIAHCVDEISELLTHNFKEIENGALDFSTFVKNVEQTMRNLSVDLVEDVMEKQRNQYLVVRIVKIIIAFSARMIRK